MHPVLVTTYIIQFCPTPQRQERLNVGLVAIGSASNELRFDFDPDAGKRAAALWPLPWVTDSVRGQCAALASRLQEARSAASTAAALTDEVESIGRRLANELVMVGPSRRMMPDSDAAFDALFQDWIKPLPKPRKERVPRIDQRLKRLFKDRDIEGYVEANIERELTFLGSPRTQKFPFAYLNGSENLLLPASFTGHGQEFDEKLAWARTLADAVRDSAPPQQPSKLAVYADFDSEAQESMVRKALPEHIACVWAAGRDDDALSENVIESFNLHH